MPGRFHDDPAISIENNKIHNMVNEQLQKKIDQSIKLLRATCADDEVVEVAYSGGKDSDVILQLAKESGIKFRAIYKMTTIDPPGTLRHVKDMGVEILRPKDDLNFFKIIEKKGFPSRMRRFCCEILKEYKVLDKAIIGVRKEESKARAERYNEPTICRFYGSKKNHVEQILPILDWTTEDVAEYLQDRNIKVAPVYYDENGNFDPSRRLGCMCCPLQSKRKRIEEFKKYPNIIKAYLIAGQKFINSHPDGIGKHHEYAYSWFYRDLFCESSAEWEMIKNNLFGTPDFKAELEKIFGIELPELKNNTNN